jgi:hypothetical protein
MPEKRIVSAGPCSEADPPSRQIMMPRDSLALAKLTRGDSIVSQQKSMFGQTHRNDIGDDGFALSWFQTRALRHPVHDVRPIFAAVTPDHWQRMAFDAAVSEKCATFVQHRKINRLSLSRGRHLRSDRWDVVGQLATGQHTGQHEKDRRLHLRDQSRKSCALENRLPRTCPLLARGL